MRIFWPLFLAAFVLLVFPHGIFGDGSVRFEALQILFNEGRLSPMKYSLVQPFFAAPFYALGLVFKNPHWWCARFNSFLFLGLLAYMGLRWKPFFTDRQRICILLCLMAATMFPKHLGDFYGEVFSVTFVSIGVSEIILGAQILGGVLLALGVANTPAMLPALVCWSLFLLFRKGRWSYAWIPALALVIFFLDNHLRLGTFMHAYGDLERSPPSVMPYSNLPGFSYPLFFGLLSILLSFGKGLVFFIPGWFLYLAWRKKYPLPPPLQTFCDGISLISAVLVLTYARWWAWSGSWFWGPRFFLLACVPAALYLGFLLAEPPRRFRHSLLLFATTLLSFWAGADSIAFDQSNLEACSVKDMDFLCLYVPEFSALWRPFVVNPGWHGKSVAYLVFFGGIFLYVSAPLALYLAKRLRRRIFYFLGHSRRSLRLTW